MNVKTKNMKNFLLLCTSTLLISCGNSTPDDSDVKDASRAAIIHDLKDPTSAKFHHNEIVSKLDDSLYSYSETVNAANSFGGSRAQNVIVKVKWAGGDPSEIQNWRLINIQYLER